MPKYVLGYHVGAGMPEDEAGQAALMERWNGWFGQLGESVVDSGNPFSQARTVAAGGAVTEGGGTNPLTGYSIISDANLDEAITLAQGCPVLEGGGSVEVAEAVDM